MPDEGATMMLSRSIVGIESYVRAAAHFEGGLRGVPRTKLNQAYANPFVLGRHAADNYFNRLPALVDPSIPMREVKPALWDRVSAFYREIRNPILHGNQLSEYTAPQFADLYTLLAEIYSWIDSWHDADSLGEGAASSFELVERRPDT